jgi:putative ABC transport system ATP-binding protein
MSWASSSSSSTCWRARRPSRTWSSRSNTRASVRVRRRRATEALQRVGLGNRLAHHPNQLSGGQQQRVAIARAIVNAPKVILADEPTGALDSRTSIDVMAIFQELWRSGITVVLVTHEADVAAFASRVVMMRDGRVVSDRTQEAKRAVATQASEGDGAAA